MDSTSIGATMAADTLHALDAAGVPMPRGWAVLVRYCGPTNYRGSRWIATGDHPIGRAVVPYSYETRHGLDNARLAADALIAKWADDYAARYDASPDGSDRETWRASFPYRIIAGGHLPDGAYAFIVA